MKSNSFNKKSLENFFNQGDPFLLARTLEGKLYRDYANRKTKKFEYEGASYFLKYHGPVGWKEIFKNIVQLKIPVIGAKREWDALQKLKILGLGCPEPLFFMKRGLNPARQESFLITKDLGETVSLEDFFDKNLFQKLTVLEKRKLVTLVAKICRKIHQNGLNHRDLYLCHFHVNQDNPLDNEIYLIDLHRGQIRKKVPFRWAVKDIGGLLHSILPFGISERECYRFLMLYFNCSLKEVMEKRKNFIDSARSRAYAMHMKPILSEISINSRKDLKNDSRYVKEEGKDYKWIGLKNSLNSSIQNALKDLDGTMKSGKVIKKEKGHFIVSLNLGGKEIFIKKYQIKNKWHFVRKIFRKSRASTSWIAIHWLRAIGISTVQPVVIYENFNCLFKLDSYLITERIDGVILSESIKDKEKDLLIASKIDSFFKKLRWINFNHGDSKTSNFFLHQDKLITFDLDTSKKYVPSWVAKKKLDKDINRILRSVGMNNRLHILLRRRIER